MNSFLDIEVEQWIANKLVSIVCSFSLSVLFAES